MTETHAPLRVLAERLDQIANAAERWHRSQTGAFPITAAERDLIREAAAVLRDAGASRASQPSPSLRETNLPDDELLRMWRSVQGPNAGLTGPLIRFAGLVYAAAMAQHESDKNWLRAQRDVAEKKLASSDRLRSENLIDSLHDVFTQHGIASRSDLPYALIGDLVSWAARKCREATERRDASTPHSSQSPSLREESGEIHTCPVCGPECSC